MQEQGLHHRAFSSSIGRRRGRSHVRRRPARVGVQAVAAPVHLASAIAGNHHGHGQEVAQRQAARPGSECQRGAVLAMPLRPEPIDPAPRRRAAAMRRRTARTTRMRRRTAGRSAAPRPADIASPRPRTPPVPAPGSCAPSAARGGTARSVVSSGTVVNVTVSASAHPQPEAADPPAQHVVVGQMIDQRRASRRCAPDPGAAGTSSRRGNPAARWRGP